MDPIGPRQAQGVLQGGLWAAAGQQVVTAEHLCDALVRVVQDDGEVIGDLPIPAGDRKVTQVPVGMQIHLARDEVVDAHDSVRGEKPQRRLTTALFASSLRRREETSTCARIADLAFGAMRCGDSVSHLCTGAHAWISEAFCEELFGARPQLLGAGGLKQRLTVPVQAQPAQVIEASLYEILTYARGVEVFEPKEHPPVAGASAPPSEEEGPRVPHMEQARRAGSESGGGLHTQRVPEETLEFEAGGDCPEIGKISTWLNSSSRPC